MGNIHGYIRISIMFHHDFQWSSNHVPMMFQWCSNGFAWFSNVFHPSTHPSPSILPVQHPWCSFHSRPSDPARWRLRARAGQGDAWWRRWRLVTVGGDYNILYYDCGCINIIYIYIYIYTCIYIYICIYEIKMIMCIIIYVYIYDMIPYINQ